MLSLPLLALTLASFGIGTTEFIIMGLLPDVAEDFGVTVPQAGFLVSAYAFGVAFGSPIVAVATARWPRRIALAGLMGVFVLGNVGCALAPSYGLLMAARVLTALAHGAFFGIGSVVARDLVPPHRRTQAVAMMFAGLTLANVLGVPFGTALGQALGWRAPFWAVSVIGLAAGAGILRTIPALPGSTASLAVEFLTLRHPRVLLPMAISALSSVSLFSVVTYITPLLETVAGLTPHEVTVALLLFGLGLLDATTQALCGVGVVFFAAAAASSAYLTASEIFPLETRALAIAVFYALGTLIGGAAAPWLFGRLIAAGSAWALSAGYCVAGVLMLTGAVMELWLGVDAEGKSLEDIAEPLSA